MKQKLLVFFLVLTVNFTASAEEETAFCPLQNPTYSELKKASEKLLKKVKLNPNCQEQEKHLEDQATSLSTTLGDVSNLVGKDNQDAQADLQTQQKLNSAVQGITALNTSLKNLSGSCGQAVPYVEAMIDSVNSLTPYLILYGGGSPATWLGVNLLGQTVKSLLSLRRSKSYDMSDYQVREIFIQNACGFYQLNENIKSIVLAKEGEAPNLFKKIETENEKLHLLKSQEPQKPAPLSKIQKLQVQFDEDFTTFTSLKNLYDQSQSDSKFSCYLVREQVRLALEEDRFPSRALKNFQILLEDPDYQRSSPPSAKQIVLSYAKLQMNPELYQPQSSQYSTCKSEAASWFQSLDQILKLTKEELLYKGRLDLTSTKDYEKYEEWKKEVSTKEEELKKLIERQKFLQKLLERGEAIEMSEVHNQRDQIHKALFGNALDGSWISTPVRGPSSEWLDYKANEAKNSLRRFKNRLPLTAPSKIGSPTQSRTPEEKDQICGFLNETLMDYRASKSHTEATSLFCDSFSETLDPYSFYHVSKFCLGSLDRQGKLESESEVIRLKADLDKQTSEFNRIRTWTQEASCKSQIKEPKIQMLF